jgi:hypothetical protein
MLTKTATIAQNHFAETCCCKRGRRGVTGGENGNSGSNEFDSCSRLGSLVSILTKIQLRIRTLTTICTLVIFIYPHCLFHPNPTTELNCLVPWIAKDSSPFPPFPLPGGSPGRGKHHARGAVIALRDTANVQPDSPLLGPHGCAPHQRVFRIHSRKRRELAPNPLLSANSTSRRSASSSISSSELNGVGMMGTTPASPFR